MARESCGHVLFQWNPIQEYFQIWCLTYLPYSFRSSAGSASARSSSLTVSQRGFFQFFLIIHLFQPGLSVFQPWDMTTDSLNRIIQCSEPSVKSLSERISLWMCTDRHRYVFYLSTLKWSLIFRRRLPKCRISPCRSLASAWSEHSRTSVSRLLPPRIPEEYGSRRNYRSFHLLGFVIHFLLVDA